MKVELDLKTIPINNKDQLRNLIDNLNYTPNAAKSLALLYDIEEILQSLFNENELRLHEPILKDLAKFWLNYLPNLAINTTNTNTNTNTDTEDMASNKNNFVTLGTIILNNNSKDYNMLLRGTDFILNFPSKFIPVINEDKIETLSTKLFAYRVVYLFMDKLPNRERDAMPKDIIEYINKWKILYQ